MVNLGPSVLPVVRRLITQRNTKINKSLFFFLCQVASICVWYQVNTEHLRNKKKLNSTNYTHKKKERIERATTKRSLHNREKKNPLRWVRSGTLGSLNLPFSWL
ncbi:unnamed protein product [Ixodes pacificus]